MCDCAKSSFDIIDVINQKRKKAGLDTVGYDWFMSKWRNETPFFQPQRKIGSSYVWDKTTARRIINAIWKMDYTPESKLFRWARYAA